MNSKVLMLSVAVIAVGLFALPSTLSMFAGQHSWYDPKDGSGIPCEKCHFIEKQELASSGGPHDPLYDGLINISMDYGGSSGNVGGATFWGADDSLTDRCYGCHQRAGSDSYTGNDDLNGSWDLHRNDQHAAIAVWCIDCHPWVEAELTHTKAAHRWFYEDLNRSTPADNIALQRPNRACLGCHTHVGVNLTWERNEFVSYDVNCDKTGYNVTWNTSDDCGINESQSGSVPGYNTT